VHSFEKKIADITGSKFAIAVVNGTAALHIALILAGVKPNDEVIMPSLTFIGTANAVKYCGAHPHFVDSEEQTLGIDPLALLDWLKKNIFIANGEAINKITNRRIRAIIPVHIFGHPCQINLLTEIANEFSIRVVEDAAEALGSIKKGIHAGVYSDLGILSFNGNKIITTGGGGMILTSNEQIAKLAKHLTTTAKVQHQWRFEHDLVGFNYRMPNINAALGCAQLEKLDDFIKSKRKLFAAYELHMAKIKFIKIFKEPPDCYSNYWLQTILLDDDVSSSRDFILNSANNAGIMLRPTWVLMHRLKMFKDCPRAPLPIAESLERRIINIPSSAGIL
jgi:aminotransferase in exopolysaccharide biosynthesis